MLFLLMQMVFVGIRFNQWSEALITYQSLKGKISSSSLLLAFRFLSLLALSYSECARIDREDTIDSFGRFSSIDKDSGIF